MAIQTPSSTGLLTSFRCPWCQEREDLSDIDEQIVIGSIIECASCAGRYEISNLEIVKQLWAEGVDD